MTEPLRSHPWRTELDVAPVSVVMHAARGFAEALIDTDVYREFDDALRRLQADHSAQRAIEAYQEKRRFHHVLLMVNGLSPEEKAELDRLHRTMLDQPSVQAYLRAQGRWTELCQALAERLSGHIGVDFSAAAGGGCCG